MMGLYQNQNPNSLNRMVYACVAILTRLWFRTVVLQIPGIYCDIDRIVTSTSDFLGSPQRVVHLQPC